ncbi:MAG: DUF2442 domain-containing protein [Spirochaetales bacterium]|nr:DUF2442 domain-containing protein [Spirochaetales bacterium]
MMMQIVQVYARPDCKIYLYFANGQVRLYDARPLLEKGVFRVLKDPDFFMNRCTVMNGTLAWDMTGNYDPTKCLDLDPEVLYQNSILVGDPLAEKDSLHQGAGR